MPDRHGYAEGAPGDEAAAVAILRGLVAEAEIGVEYVPQWPVHDSGKTHTISSDLPITV